MDVENTYVHVYVGEIYTRGRPEMGGARYWLLIDCRRLIPVAPAALLGRFASDKAPSTSYTAPFDFYLVAALLRLPRLSPARQQQIWA